jgi:hypothetical protein
LPEQGLREDHCAVSETPPESRELLIQQLEKLTGRTLKTREDVQAYFREAAERKPSMTRWLKAKKMTLFALLAFSAIQYYILDVMLEIASMRSTTFFVPASTRLIKSALETLS